MQNLMRFSLAFSCSVLLLTVAVAQPPAGKDKKDYSNSPIVTRMMAFDKNKDGKLTKDEVTDTRLHRLFDQADTNKDGVVTKVELMALAAKLDEENGQGGGPGGRGPGGPGGRGQGGPGGPGGPGGRGPGRPGGFGGPPQPGQVLPPFMADQLKLTDEQKKQFEALQKEVDARFDKILTEEQKRQLKEMRDRGPGGFGPPGGGRPGSGPPGGGRPGPGGPDR